MTYGWAILVVLIGISVLASFGVLNAEDFLSNSCTLPSGLACVDHRVENLPSGNARFTLRLQNSIGFDISITGAEIQLCNSLVTNMFVSNGDGITITVNCNKAIYSSVYKGEMNITYENSDTGLSHKFNGFINSKVEGVALPDVTPPVLSNGLPTVPLLAGTTSVIMSLDTNENANCRYSTIASTIYSAMTDTFSTTGSISHLTIISGLSDGNTYNFYIRCEDSSSNENIVDFPISFDVLI